jgi:succinyl-CoA synthetase beta subunit
MWLPEALAKQKLAEHGVLVPLGSVVKSPAEAEAIARRFPCGSVIKAQVPFGQRGKRGAVRFAATPAAAAKAAGDLLGSTIQTVVVQEVLVEERVPVARELFAAVTREPSGASPVVLFCSAGGVDVEETHAIAGGVRQRRVDIRRGFNLADAEALASDAPPSAKVAVASVLTELYGIYRELDAELVEVNPLALATDGRLMALDCKLVVDDSALSRHPNLPTIAVEGTPLERRARAEGLLFIELDGNVGVLANGAGLTMATLDAVVHFNGRPANFMEIGGDAYKKSATALSILLDHPGVQGLLINLCGAYARTDVIVGGLLAAWRELQPTVPVVFSIHGTGEDEAVRLVRDGWGVEPYPQMDDAVQAAIALAARRPTAGR